MEKTQILDDYEEGVLIGKIKLRINWWEFWKPKFINHNIGNYTKIGKTIKVNIKVGEIGLSGIIKNGMVSGVIRGLPDGCSKKEIRQAEEE